MATYTEIAELLSIAEPLRKRVAIAAMVSAEQIRLAADDGTAAMAQKKRFAQRIYSTQFTDRLISRQDTAAFALNRDLEAIYRAVIISNRSFTLAQIRNATDAAIQTAVDAAVNFLAATFNDPVVTP